MLEGRVPHLNLFLVIKGGIAAYSCKINRCLYYCFLNEENVNFFFFSNLFCIQNFALIFPEQLLRVSFPSVLADEFCY